jgi:hypothetical protein
MVPFCFLFSTVGAWASWEGGGIGVVGSEGGGGMVFYFILIFLTMVVTQLGGHTRQTVNNLATIWL